MYSCRRSGSPQNLSLFIIPEKLSILFGLSFIAVYIYTNSISFDRSGGIVSKTRATKATRMTKHVLPLARMVICSGQLLHLIRFSHQTLTHTVFFGRAVSLQSHFVSFQEFFCLGYFYSYFSYLSCKEALRLVACGVGVP